MDATTLTPGILAAVRGKAKRLRRGRPADQDDLAQEGALAAWKARATWRPELHVPWPAYAVTKAGYAMLDYLRARLPMIRAKGLPPPPVAQLHTLAWNDEAEPVAPGGPPWLAYYHREAVAVALGCLEPRLRGVVAAYYLERRPAHVVAERFGLSETRVYQLLAEARGRMLARLEPDG